MSSVGPVNVLREEAKEEKGENARLQTFVGAIALSDLVKTTLGPKGMDKILQAPSGKLTITNDGATILKSVVIDNPAAKVLIDISRVQEEEVGDGTTTVCVLAGELLRQAEKLVDQKYHPQTIIEGYRAATDIAMKALQDYSFSAEELQSNSPSESNNGNKGASSNDLLPPLKDDEEYSPLYLNMLNLARTTLSSKVLGSNVSNDSAGGIAATTSTSTLEHFSRMCVDAVCSVGGIQKIIKKGEKEQENANDQPVLVDLRMIPIIKIKGGNSTNAINDPSGLSPVLSNSALCDSFLIENGLVMEHNATNWASVKCPSTVRTRRNVSSHYTILRTLENSDGINVLCVNTPLDVDRVKIAGMKVKTRETGEEIESESTGSRIRRTGCVGIEDEEKAKLRAKCKKLMTWGTNESSKANIDVLFSRQIVYDYPMSLFSNPSSAFGQKTKSDSSNKGVLVFDNVGFDDVERLAILTKGKLVGCVMGNDEDEVTSPEDLGHCLSISEIMVGEETLTLVRSSPANKTGENNKIAKSSCVSIVLRGSSDYLLDEAERSVVDALSALAMLVRCSKSQNDSTKQQQQQQQQQRNRSMRLVYGGGACECRMACAINEAADNGLTPYPPSILHGFATALVAIPEAVASNCGLPGRMVGEALMSHHRRQYAHEKGRDVVSEGKDKSSMSNTVLDACVSSRNADGVSSARCSNGMSVVDTLLGKERILCGASEAAEEVIRVDCILTAAERKRQG